MSTLVLAKIDCGNTILGTVLTAPSSPSKKYQILVRITLKIPRRDSTHQGLKKTALATYAVQNHLQLLCLVHSGLRGSGPIYLQYNLKVKHIGRAQILSNRKKTLADRGFSYMAATHLE